MLNSLIYRIQSIEYFTLFLKCVLSASDMADPSFYKTVTKKAAKNQKVDYHHSFRIFKWSNCKLPLMIITFCVGKTNIMDSI